MRVSSLRHKREAHTAFTDSVRPSPLTDTPERALSIRACGLVCVATPPRWTRWLSEPPLNRRSKAVFAARPWTLERRSQTENPRHTSEKLAPEKSAPGLAPSAELGYSLAVIWLGPMPA